MSNRKNQFIYHVFDDPQRLPTFLSMTFFFNIIIGIIMYFFSFYKPTRVLFLWIIFVIWGFSYLFPLLFIRPYHALLLGFVWIIPSLFFTYIFYTLYKEEDQSKKNDEIENTLILLIIPFIIHFIYKVQSAKNIYG